MPSVFEKITRVVVQEMDPRGDMIAVRSLVDANRFHCFYLVLERRNFLGCRYYKTDLTLKDILETEKGEGQFDELDSGFQGQKAEFQVTDMVDSKGMLTVKLPKEITIAGAFQGSQEQRIEILATQISPQYLDSLENRKLKRKLPAFFRSIQTKRKDLYLVTETVETTKKETLESKWQCTLWSKINFGSFKLEHKHQRAVTIPPKCVLGYRIKQLVFPNTERMNICFLGETKSFPEEKDGGSSCLGKSLNLEDFRNMKEKVQDMVIGLQDLTEEERKDVLSCLTECLSKDGQLQDLEQRVSEVLISGELQMEGPAGPLISSLFNDAGILVQARIEAILDVLDALMELSEEQQLVAEALGKGTLTLLKGQVESILEQNPGEQPHEVGCDPEARILCALYVVVSILLQLSEKPTSVSS
ncbi:gasdermin-B isoform X1 [Diceros bicornis minor]|uniref:gasdermin-B isoform X1 n=1 Tax=Diceros bicornis minor TaxID=77932 RepID=UPI0026EED353|nr:gasdermin-B isoform X1 [Diceros bicornis minor]